MNKGNSNIKKKKFEERILNDLNLILRQHFTDKKLQFASFTKVELSLDYSIATVYWDTFDDGKRGEIKSSLESLEGKLRTHLAKVMKVRHTPQIKLEYDGQFEGEQSIIDILQSEAKKGKTF